jgi:hypothetical protein
MALKYTTQLTKVVDKAGYDGYSLLKPNERFGRVRMDWFDFAGDVEGAVGGALAATDTVDLARLPSSARILGVFITNTDWGTDVDLHIGLKGTDGSGAYTKGGTADDNDFLAASVDITSVRAMPTNVANLNVGYVTDKNVTVYGTVVDGGTIAITAASTLKGYVLYVVD